MKELKSRSSFRNKCRWCLRQNKERDNDLLGDILARINVPKSVIKENKDTEKLCKEGETVDDVANLPVDDFLKRWFNSHLQNAGYPNELTNFSDDLKDSEKYTTLWMIYPSTMR